MVVSLTVILLLELVAKMAFAPFDFVVILLFDKDKIHCFFSF